ncbi:TnsD family Tn7-like transposition protein, partial [Hyphomonas atlantica]|uniref:TnsD family Tn7-like transposition protein n=1 Tax=Hyphomonas atlantica TaxID=1280948 RepID=UPI00351451DB
GVDVCHKHGIRLGTSSSYSDANRLKLIEPDCDLEGASDESQQPPFEGCLEFAKLSAKLLDHPPPARSPLAWNDYYRERLADRGLLRGNCQINAKKIATQIRRFWSGFAGVPHCGRMTDEPAITRFFGNRRRLAPPAQHILIDRALDAAPLMEGPFGAPPYACENPLVDHFGQRVVTQLTLVRDRGKIHGHFACVCGYSYSRTRQVNGEIGTPRIREYGPLADAFLNSEKASQMSLRAKARHMRVDPMTVKAIAQRGQVTGNAQGVSGVTLPKS